MKKEVAAFTVTLLLAGSVTFAATPNEKLDFSVEHWNKNGSFDYSLHYGDASQLLSKVSAPQNQNMVVYSLKYKPDKRHFVRLQYGTTGTGTNGHGDDSDWATYDSPDELTDYGTMDFYGKETLYSIDLGKYLSKKTNKTTSFFVGWGSEETSNEIKNVVYHRSNGIDIGNVSQPDNGSYLNGDFGGAHLGLENDYTINKKLSVNSSLVLKQMTAKAYGHWANHVPAWNWENDGEAWGYDAKIGLNYGFNANTSANLGCYYSFAKANRTDETMNTGTQILDLPSIADLQYKKQGYYFGLNHKF
jgi:hypothetical protein